jgi:hypothetical protein
VHVIYAEPRRPRRDGEECVREQRGRWGLRIVFDAEAVTGDAITIADVSMHREVLVTGSAVGLDGSTVHGGRVTARARDALTDVCAMAGGL